jgi:hypothetical protein
VTFREACHNAREYTYRTGDTTCIMLDQALESYFYTSKPEAYHVRVVRVVTFYSTKYGTVEARDL